MTEDKYAALRQALDAAHEQAAEGKGKERHARDGQDFTEQPIMAITRMVGLGYPCGQAMKKLQEAVGMAERGEHEAAQREMLGAINYAAAAWIRVGEMVSSGLEGSDDEQLMTSDDEPPVPWDQVHPDARFITRDADGSIDAWDGKNRPALWHNKLWDGEADEMMRLRWPDGGEHAPKIWERPAQDDDEPPVPWEHAPSRVRYFTRDANGTIDAWIEARSVLHRGVVWCGRDIDMIRWRPGDGGEHEPKIWERPKDD